MRSPRRSGRVGGALLVALLVGLGLVALERAGTLPESLATAVRQAERWLAPVLEPVLAEVGLELPLPRADEAAPPSRLPAPPSASGDQAAVAQALDLLEGVPVEAERPRGYERESWPHWLDGDRDCQDARQEVLLAESLEPARLDDRGCRLVAGSWRDAYTGEVHRDPGELDVDHFVPLAEAHRSGGHAWSPERRAAFANDLEDTRTLIAVSASVNRSKSDQGPEEWLPPVAAYHCHYAADWVAVKARWRLSMDERERVTLGNLLQGCTQSGGP